MSLDSINKDVAKIIGTFAGNFFPLSSISRKFRGFFEEERKRAVGKVKILVKDDLDFSLLLTFDGKLYACGSNSSYLLNLRDEDDNRRQWTSMVNAEARIDEPRFGS